MNTFNSSILEAEAGESLSVRVVRSTKEVPDSQGWLHREILSQREGERVGGRQGEREKRRGNRCD